MRFVEDEVGGGGGCDNDVDFGGHGGLEIFVIDDGSVEEGGHFFGAGAGAIGDKDSVGAGAMEVSGGEFAHFACAD